MSKKGTLPDLLFVAPIGHPRHKIRHSHVVFLVTEWDSDGIPTVCRLARDDEKFSTERVQNSGAEFMTAYVQSQMLLPRPEKADKRSDYDA